MIRKITLFLLLVSMMIPMTLSAQEVRKDVLANFLFSKDNRSLLKKNVPAPAVLLKLLHQPMPLSGTSSRRISSTNGQLSIVTATDSIGNTSIIQVWKLAE